MPLIEKIEELRNKPENVRYRILIASIVAIMSIIVFVWLSVINISLEPKQNDKNDSALAPINAVANTVKDGFSTVKTQLKSLFQNTI